MNKAAESTKSRLQAYLNACRELELQELRLDQKRAAVGDIKSPTLDAMPKAYSSSDPNARKVLELLRLEERVKDLKTFVRDEHEALELAIQRMRNAEQRMVLRMKYFDGMSWDEINFVFYGERIDFLTEESRYRQQLYDIHSRALVSLASVLARHATLH